MQIIIKILYYLWPIITIVSVVTGIVVGILSLRSKDNPKKARNMVILVIAIIFSFIGCLSGVVNLIFDKDISYIDTKIDDTQGELEQTKDDVSDKTQTSDQPDETSANNNTSDKKANNNTSDKKANENASEVSDEPEKFSVSVSYGIIPFPLTDKNCQITADTTLNAERVTLTAVSDTYTSETFLMSSTDGKHWTFAANFYLEGTYTITVTAYKTDGTTAKDSISITYPFY